jgi:ribosomal protein S27AE
MHDTIPCPPPLPSDTERCPAPTERCPAWYALEDARIEYDAAKAQQGFCPSCGRHGTFLGVQEGLVHWNCGRGLPRGRLQLRVRAAPEHDS